MWTYNFGSTLSNDRVSPVVLKLETSDFKILTRSHTSTVLHLLVRKQWR